MATSSIRGVEFEGCVAEALQTTSLTGSKWSCSLLRIVMQDATGEGMKVYPPLTLKVQLDDVTALVEGRNKELPGIAEKVLKSTRRKVAEKGLKLSITEGGKEGKTKVIA